MTEATAEQLEDIVTDNDVGGTVREELADALGNFDEDLQSSEIEDVPGKPVEASKESVPEKEAVEDPPSETDQEKTDQVAKETDAEDAPGSLTAPSSWSAEEKAEFSDLPSKAQSAILRREGDRDRAFQQKLADVNQTAQRYAAMDQVIAPHKETFALNGVNPATLFNQYLAIEKSLATDPAGTIQMLAQRVGVDLSSLNAAVPEVTPEIAQLQSQLNDTRQQLSSFQTERTNQNSALQQQNHTKLQGDLKNFAMAVDDAGVLKHPHFEELRVSMGALIQAGQATDMEAAYEKALWASSHRDGLIANQQRAADRKAEEERRARGAKALKAGKGVSGAPGGAEPAAPAGSIREELEKGFAAGI